VESIEQLLVLLELGCPVVQGYAVSRPMRFEATLSWLRSFQADPRWRVAQLGYPTRADFDLLLLQAAHRNWFARARLALQGRLPADAAPPERHAACRVTHWYEDNGRVRYRDDAEFQAILAIHRDLHDAVEQALEHVADAPALKQLELRSEELLGRLHAFRIRVARHDPLSRPPH
jgi:hypothetical protein